MGIAISSSSATRVVQQLCNSQQECGRNPLSPYCPTRRGHTIINAQGYIHLRRARDPAERGRPSRVKVCRTRQLQYADIIILRNLNRGRHTIEYARLQRRPASPLCPPTPPTPLLTTLPISSDLSQCPAVVPISSVFSQGPTTPPTPRLVPQRPAVVPISSVFSQGPTTPPTPRLVPQRPAVVPISNFFSQGPTTPPTPRLVPQRPAVVLISSDLSQCSATPPASCTYTQRPATPPTPCTDVSHPSAAPSPAYANDTAASLSSHLTGSPGVDSRALPANTESRTTIFTSHEALLTRSTTNAAPRLSELSLGTAWYHSQRESVDDRLSALQKESLLPDTMPHRSAEVQPPPSHRINQNQHDIQSIPPTLTALETRVMVAIAAETYGNLLGTLPEPIALRAAETVYMDLTNRVSGDSTASRSPPEELPVGLMGDDGLNLQMVNLPAMTPPVEKVEEPPPSLDRQSTAPHRSWERRHGGIGVPVQGAMEDVMLAPQSNGNNGSSERVGSGTSSEQIQRRLSDGNDTEPAQPASFCTPQATSPSGPPGLRSKEEEWRKPPADSVEIGSSRRPCTYVGRRTAAEDSPVHVCGSSGGSDEVAARQGTEAMDSVAPPKVQYEADVMKADRPGGSQPTPRAAEELNCSRSPLTVASVDSPAPVLAPPPRPTSPSGSRGVSNPIATAPVVVHRPPPEGNRRAALTAPPGLHTRGRDTATGEFGHRDQPHPPSASYKPPLVVPPHAKEVPPFSPSEPSVRRRADSARPRHDPHPSVSPSASPLRHSAPASAKRAAEGQPNAVLQPYPPFRVKSQTFSPMSCENTSHDREESARTTAGECAEERGRDGAKSDCLLPSRRLLGTDGIAAFPGGRGSSLSSLSSPYHTESILNQSSSYSSEIGSSLGRPSLTDSSVSFVLPEEQVGGASDSRYIQYKVLTHQRRSRRRKRKVKRTLSE